MILLLFQRLMYDFDFQMSEILFKYLIYICISDIYIIREEKVGPTGRKVVPTVIQTVHWLSIYEPSLLYVSRWQRFTNYHIHFSSSNISYVEGERWPKLGLSIFWSTKRWPVSEHGKHLSAYVVFVFRYWIFCIVIFGEHAIASINLVINSKRFPLFSVENSPFYV